jgi:cytochrome P450
MFLTTVQTLLIGRERVEPCRTKPYDWEPPNRGEQMRSTHIPTDPVTVEELWDDPYPIYARMRRDAPVCFVPSLDMWFVTRWADVEYGATHPELFPASVVGSPLDRTLGGTNVLTVEGEAHRELRAPLDRALRPRVLEERAPGIVRSLADELLDAIADRGEADLIAEYFEPLSTRSLAQVIGIGDLEAPVLVHWFRGLATGTANYERDPEKQRVADAVSAEVDEALRPLFARRLDDPDDTMVSFLIHAVDGDLDERLRRVMPTLKLVLIGGLQEPGHGMGSTVFGLLHYPDQRAAFGRDPSGLARKAVDEGLRWVSPIGTQARASAGTDLAGQWIDEGATVALIVPSANRDETVWGPTADDFDLFRPRHQHAAFGFGDHFCVGHYLARIQMRMAIERLFERLRGLRLDDDRPAVLRGWEYRSPEHLHVRWDA